MLGRLPLPAAARRPLQRIHDAVAQLKETTQALLMLSRAAAPTDTADAMSEPPMHEPCALHEIVPPAIADHEHLLAGRPVRFVLGPTAPVVLQAPPVLLRILIGNLLRNAAAATAQGDVHVTLEPARLAVADPGHGFDTEQAEARRAGVARRRTDARRRARLVPLATYLRALRLDARLRIDPGTRLRGCRVVPAKCVILKAAGARRPTPEQVKRRGKSAPLGAWQRHDNEQRPHESRGNESPRRNLIIKNPQTTTNNWPVFARVIEAHAPTYPSLNSRRA